jgi:adenine-specific DNA-methyltransferase
MGRPGRKQDRLEVGLDVLDSPGSLDLAGIAAGISDGITPEHSYLSAVPFGHRRRYAQFFTPVKIARLMAEWALAESTCTLLDPAIVMGVLVRAALARKPDLRVTAFEKDPTILRAYLSTQPDLNKIEVIFGDFLTLDVLSRFDAVIMNPPYLRHHDLSYEFDIFGQFSHRYGVDISKLSNSYLLFTLKAATLLKPGGRASIIIPTEWMNANFGAAMKSFLIKRNLLREVIYFSNCSEIFDDALTTACILLIEKPLL